MFFGSGESVVRVVGQRIRWTASGNAHMSLERAVVMGCTSDLAFAPVQFAAKYRQTWKTMWVGLVGARAARGGKVGDTSHRARRGKLANRGVAANLRELFSSRSVICVCDE